MSLEEDKTKEKAKPYKPISLNVGGKVFTTTELTLQSNGEPNYFNALISGRMEVMKDDNGAFFVDRDHTYFQHILNYLRDPRWTPEKENFTKQDIQKLLFEAEFYQIISLVDMLKKELSLYKKTYVKITCGLFYHVHTPMLSDLFDGLVNNNFVLESTLQLCDSTTNLNHYVHYVYTSDKPSPSWYDIINKYKNKKLSDGNYFYTVAVASEK
jgi:hypothetical protein